jgi:DNA-binding transcriptional MerR regulator
MHPFNTLEELAEKVGAWCREHRVEPLSLQASPTLSLRNLRYYRTLGLMDGPADEGYTEKHFLQLAAVRVLQSKGAPLKKIQALLYGRSVDDLRRVLKEGTTEGGFRGPSRVVKTHAIEQWCAMSIDDEWLLLSRNGRQLPPETLRAIKDLLAETPSILKRHSTLSTS